ncbi:hypothetical protein MAR_012333, partial [Mya arenaria]
TVTGEIPSGERIEFLEAELDQFIGPVATRNRSMNGTEKILIPLRYLATAGIQLNDGYIHHVSQPSVSRAVGQSLIAGTILYILLQDGLVLPMIAECLKKVDFMLCSREGMYLVTTVTYWVIVVTHAKCGY